MATGLEALGAASAVLQVISFAADLVSACRKVYDGNPTQHDDLQEHATRMSDAADRVQSRCESMAKTRPLEHDAKLDAIAKGCRAAAKELETEIKFVTSMQVKGSLFKAVNTILRASSHRKKIERLELSLFRYRHVMETELLSHLWQFPSRCNPTPAEDDFDSLATDVQTLVANISQGHTKLEDLVRTEHAMTREFIVRGATKTEQALKAHVTTEIQAMGNSAESEAQRKCFLGSLKSMEMNRRYNDLMNSRDATFDRVFTSYEEVISKDADCEVTEAPDSSHQDMGTEHDGKAQIYQAWAGFVEWLQSSDQLFSIQGKPGSGKSTLVKFVIDNKTTRQLLCRWSVDAMIISHFFWKIGSSPQNSVKGLLCSLLYQMLAGNSAAMGQALDRFRHLSSHTSYDDWSTEDLKAVLYSILDKAQHVCIFIDGMDEICNRDGLARLTRVTNEMLEFPNIKMCVATRPETQVISWLNKRNSRSILLEDLTRPDMRSYAHKELDPYISDTLMSELGHANLIQQLVDKAQGVFLWFHLATRSLTTGIQNRDSEQMLFSRLGGLPSELMQLYSDMWKRMNENNSVYRKTAARYFRYVLHRPGAIKYARHDGQFYIDFPSLFQVARGESGESEEMLLPSTDSMSISDVECLCQRTELAIKTRCAGLLQMAEPRLGMARIMRSPGDVDPIASTVPRKREWLEQRIFKGFRFIHRTAHDFLADTEAGKEILKCDSLPYAQLKGRMIKGLVCLVRWLHYKYGLKPILSNIAVDIEQLSSSYGRQGVEEAIKLLPMVQHLHDDRLLGVEGATASWRLPVPFLSIWTPCPQLDDFVISSLTKANSVPLATNILREAWGYKSSNKAATPSDRLFEALISMGADAHLNGPRRRALPMFPFVNMGTAFSDFLMGQMLSMGRSHHCPEAMETARSILSMAVNMAMTCPDLSATTLVPWLFQEHDSSAFQVSLGLVLGDTAQGTYPPSLRNKYTYILYEVDFKFLLFHLLSELSVHIGDNMESFGDSRLQELLPRLENPSAKMRLILKYNEKLDSPPSRRRWICQSQCHRVAPELATAREVCEITDDLFGGRPAERKTLHERLMRLITDAGTEEVDLESAILPFANEGIGLCTLWQAGMKPPRHAIEEWEQVGSNYPGLLAQAKRELSEATEEESDDGWESCDENVDRSS